MTKTNRIEEFAGWENLEPKEQQTVRLESETIAEALLMENQSRVAIGESLGAVRSILQPKHMWIAFLKEKFHMSRATAYRYIEEYEAVSKALPKKMMSIAKERGLKIRPQSLVRNPPPVTADTEEIVHYLERLERPTVVNPPREQDSDMLLKECVNFVRSRFSRLPNNQRAKTAFIRSLIGMMLSTFGISSEVSYGPVAVPDHFKAVRGRPRLAKAA